MSQTTLAKRRWYEINDLRERSQTEVTIDHNIQASMNNTEDNRI